MPVLLVVGGFVAVHAIAGGIAFGTVTAIKHVSSSTSTVTPTK